VAGRRSAGVAGSAVLAGTAGLYLVYVGVKDVPFFDGLRELLRGTAPVGKVHAPFVPKPSGVVGTPISSGATGKNDKSIDRLVGNAAAAYPAIRAIAPGAVYGWGLRSDMSSDHPKGKALDVMLTDEATAQRVISTFRSQPGAKYWIWNRQIANVAVDNWRIRPYNGPSPHIDHVHLSYT